MKERPILFSGPMVQALLAGRKTQTRRVVKWPAWLKGDERDGLRLSRSPTGLAQYEDGVPIRQMSSPYGQPGDRLWVRETWGYRGASWNNGKPEQHEVRIHYQADDSRRDFIRKGKDWSKGLPKQRPPPQAERADDWDAMERYDDYFRKWWSAWRPSIFMPRWACRLVLEVADVRVERLQDISEEDAKAEGVVLGDKAWLPMPPGETWTRPTHRDGFRTLWESINGPESWAANPWVWCISFKRV